MAGLQQISAERMNVPHSTVFFNMELSEIKSIALLSFYLKIIFLYFPFLLRN